MAGKTCKKCGLKWGGSAKNKQRRRKNSTKKYRLRKIGGGCGCGGTDVKPWIGGNNEIPAYPLNKHEFDPNSPSEMIASRNVPDIISGGRKRKGRKTTKRRKMRGGDFFLGNNPNMPILSFGTTSGAYDFDKHMNLQTGVDPAPYVQPVLKMYGDHNYPLV